MLFWIRYYYPEKWNRETVNLRSTKISLDLKGCDSVGRVCIFRGTIFAGVCCAFFTSFVMMVGGCYYIFIQKLEILELHFAIVNHNYLWWGIQGINHAGKWCEILKLLFPIGKLQEPERVLATILVRIPHVVSIAKSSKHQRTWKSVDYNTRWDPSLCTRSIL